MKRIKSGWIEMYLSLFFSKPVLLLRGNVGENQRGAPTCRRNLCSYSGYQYL